VLETASMLPPEVDRRIEQLCETYEEMKSYLIGHWFEDMPAPPSRELIHDRLSSEVQS
jgi:hypothetical protein